MSLSIKPFSLYLNLNTHIYFETLFVVVLFVCLLALKTVRRAVY